MADEQRDFWSRVARKYDRVVDQQLGGRTRALVRERLAMEGRLGHVVEFGCGTGFNSGVLAAKAIDVVATDLAPGMLAIARVNAAPNVTFRVEDCQRTSFADASFDTAFVGLVLHFTEPERTLAEMHRILKPGGTLLIANLDPELLSGFAKARAMARILYRGVTGYRTKPPKRLGRNVVTDVRIRAVLEQAGFRNVTSEVIRDPANTASIPIGYVRAINGGALTRDAAH